MNYSAIGKANLCFPVYIQTPPKSKSMMSTNSADFILLHSTDFNVE